MTTLSFAALTGRSLALARRRQQPALAPMMMAQCPSIARARRIDALPTRAHSSSSSFSFADADAALARRRALFLASDAAAPSSPTTQPLRIWRVGIDEPRLLKALEGAGFAGRVVVCSSASGCDAVLAVARKAAGGRQRVDLGAARSAARCSRRWRP